MDGAKDDAVYEDFLGKGVAVPDDVMDNNGYPDYYGNSPVMHEILDNSRASFFADDEIDSDFEGF